MSAQVPAAVTFDKDASWAYLLKQCAFGPRVPGTDAHKQCRDYLLAELGKYTDNAHLSEFTHDWTHNHKTMHMWNIIGEQNWANAKERIILMAHWDSRPFASQEEDPIDREKPILGADDGASGVAVLLQLAKQIKDKHPDVGVQYVLTDGEDLGPGIDEMLLGAADYATHLPALKPDYGILLDMIGNTGVSVPMEPNSYRASSQLVESFYKLAKTSGLGETFPSKFGPEIEDDHLPVIAAGVPMMDLIDFSYPAWHTLKDTPAQCSADSLGAIGEMLRIWVCQPKPFILNK